MEIILAKTTMSEWARGGLDNINSVLPGFARNPYNTAYATGGSSGGTGSGLAASFGVVGLGSDTFGSIRNPASNNALVGLRTSWALVSRAGMVGLYDKRDTAGPMARSVTDLVQLLDVIAGVDPADPATAEASGKTPPTYMAFLKRDGIVGRRIGVFRQASRPGLPIHKCLPYSTALSPICIMLARRLSILSSYMSLTSSRPVSIR